MKYIEVPSLTALASSLSHQGPECNVSVRLEAYSCKNIKRDKRLFRDLERIYWDDLGLLEGITVEDSSLAQAHSSLSTPFGPLGSPQSRKTLYLLIATLNVAFPDYTFDSVKPSSFIHLESGAQILNALSTTLLASRSLPRNNSGLAYGAYPATQGLGFGIAQGSPSSPYEHARDSPHAPSSVVSGTHPEVYALIDEVIGPLDECEVFEYAPEPEEDPNAGEGEGDEDEEELEQSEHNSWREEHLFALDEDMDPTPNPLLTPRAAVLSSTTNAVSPFHESYRPRPSSPSPTRSRLISRGSSSSFLSSAYPPMTPISSSGSNPLLWSSHWFFLNRKQKRILYVSVWARRRTLASILRSPVDEEYFVYDIEPAAVRNRRIRQFSGSDESDGSPISMKEKERFVGWEGASGAGARALGIDH